MKDSHHTYHVTYGIAIIILALTLAVISVLVITGDSVFGITSNLAPSTVSYGAPLPLAASMHQVATTTATTTKMAP